MKIMYVDLKYDYGKKERGLNTIGQYGFLSSLKKLGNEVLEFYFDKYITTNSKDSLQTDIKNYADSNNPDIILISLFTDQFDIKTLEYLKSRYKTVGWFGDDTWRFDNFTCKYALYFTYCVTTDKFSIDKYKKIGQNNIIYSQWAAIDSYETPKFNEYKYDVSFVGGYHPYRDWFISMLKTKGIKIEAFGHGWKNGPLSLIKMNELFASSKINLNLSNSTSFDIRYLTSSLKALPITIKSRKSMGQIKARNFEIPYWGGFQLTDYFPTIEEYFQIGTEIICYTSISEAAILIEYYLKNYNLRENIKENGIKRARTCHSYTNRFKNILEEIK